MEDGTEILTDTNVMDSIGDKLLEYFVGDALSQQIVDHAIQNAINELTSEDSPAELSG